MYLNVCRESAFAVWQHACVFPAMKLAAKDTKGDSSTPCELRGDAGCGLDALPRHVTCVVCLLCVSAGLPPVGAGCKGWLCMCGGSEQVGPGA